MNLDKAGKEYWDRNWENYGLPGAVDPKRSGLSNHLNREFHKLFQKTFPPVDGNGRSLLEVGCARSAWLPYFAKEFGFKVHGLDYSEVGCRQAAQILTNEGVQGEIECADFFSPPERMLGEFDAVVSFGVVEHFADTAGCIRQFSKFLKPDGLMVTIVPNMVGALGVLQKIVNRPAFDVHVPLKCQYLARAHEDAGLESVSCEYLLFASLTIINLENFRGTPFHGAAVRIRSSLSKALWAAEKNVALLSPNRLSSPYIVCVARKPCA